MALTKEQLAERRRYLGASEAAAALGMSKWRTPLEVYLSKMGKAEDVEETLPMMVGNALEPVCLALYERDAGVKVKQRQAVFHDNAASWRRCTVDGITEHGWLVEAKTSGVFADWGDGDDEIPLAYLVNVHHSFACMPDVGVAVFPVILGGRDFRIYTVERKEKMVEMVREAEEHFWQHVVTQNPPDPINSSDVRVLYPRDNGQVIQASKEIVKVVQEFATVASQIKVLKEKHDDLKFQLESFMGPSSEMRRALADGDQLLATFNAHDETRVVPDTLRKRHPAIAAECSETKPVRKFLCKVKVK